MEMKQRSELKGKSGKLIAFGFMDDPKQKGDFLEITIFRLEDEYILCLTHGPLAGIPLNVRAAVQRPDLGSMVPSESFMASAQRGIDGKLPFEQLKTILNSTFQLEWA